MKSKNFVSAAIGASVLLASAPLAAAKITLAPVVADSVQMRFNRSVPTLQRDDDMATVIVTPLPLNRGRFSFAIAAFNKAPGSFNLGIENVTAQFSDGTPVRILSKDDLVRQAKNRAMWAQVGMALATGIAGAAAATSAGQHSYNSTVYSPYGTYRYHGTYVNHTERMLATSAATAGGSYAIASIQNGLDNLVANLGETVLQTTTIDPGTGYGGTVVLDKVQWKPKSKAGKLLDQNLTITITANGRQYPFTFDLR